MNVHDFVDMIFQDYYLTPGEFLMGSFLRTSQLGTTPCTNLRVHQVHRWELTLKH